LICKGKIVENARTMRHLLLSCAIPYQLALLALCYAGAGKS
jgi:hypothetical protein